MIDKGDDIIGEPSLSAVKVEASGIEFVGFGTASVNNVLISGWLVEYAPFDGFVADSCSELIADAELAEGDPLDFDALGSVACDASMLLVLLEPDPVVVRLAVVPSGNFVPGLFDSSGKASGPDLLGFAGSGSDRVDLD